MIRTTLFAWASGIGLMVGAATLSSGPKPTVPALSDSGDSTPTATAAPAAALAPSPAAQPAPARTAEAQTPEPQPPAPTQPPATPQAPTPTPTPVSVQFDGVSPSQIVGDRVNLNLTTAGNVKSYAWSIMPPGTIGLKIYDGGSKADFTSRFPGTYVFLVAVAGADGSVAQAYHSLELRADYAPAPQQAAASPKPTASDPSVLVRGWAAEVKSLNRRAEQLQIASAFRQAAGAIDSGMLSGGDLFGQTKLLCALSLGGAAGAWTPWFDKVEQLYREFDRLKVLSTPANFSAANKSVARALETME